MARKDQLIRQQPPCGVGTPLTLLALLLVLVLGQHALEERPGSWPLSVTLRHLAAKPNCAAARAVGLAPARRGEPGYWPSHDADNDGIACEPYPRSLRSSPYPGPLRLSPVRYDRWPY